MDEELIFRSARNYKRGIYVFNAYKKRDFIILLIFVTIGLVVLFISMNSVDTIKNGAILSMIIIGVPAFLTLPMHGFHAMYYRLYYLFRFYLNNRIYTWAGHEEEDYTEVEDE